MDFDLDGRDLSSKVHIRSIFETVEEPFTISSLPPEILSVILTLAQITRRFPWEIPSEVILSHVSNFWRTVALNTPHLWTNIDVYSRHSMEWLPSYLARSGTSLSLDVNIDIYTYDKFRTRSYPLSGLRFIEDLAHHLTPHIDRIRRLFFFSYSENSAFLFLTHFPTVSASKLQRWQMKYDRRITPYPGPKFRGFNILSGGSPHLSYLETELLNNLPVPSSLQSLTTLHLHSCSDSSNLSYQSLMEVLTAPRSLTYLSLQGSITDSTSRWPKPSAGPQFELSNLRALRIRNDGMMAVRMLLAMSAPKLESLWLDCSFTNFDILFNTLIVNNCPAKFQSVKYLTLVDHNFQSQESFAKLFPGLTHLHCPHAFIIHLHALKQALLNNWPDLYILAFSQLRERNGEALYNVLTDVCAARRRSGKPIQKVLVNEDHLRALTRAAPNVVQLLNVTGIHADNFKEIWWNRLDNGQ